jgi:hypothetical protein
LRRRQKLAVGLENVLGNSVGGYKNYFGASKKRRLSVGEHGGGVGGVSLDVVSDE